MRRTCCYALVAAVISLVVPAAASAATKSAVIDFDSISAPQSPTGEGLIVSQVSSGNGISGDTFTGFAGVFGDSTNPAIVTNAAVVFDATCTVDGAGGTPSDCSGQDGDLYAPALGNVLIVAEDLVDANNNGRIDDPDDSDLVGDKLVIDLSTLAKGNFDVKSLDIIDVDDNETGGVIELFDDGPLVGSVPIPVAGDGSVQTISIGPDGEGVDKLVITLGGSAAIDNIRLVAEEDETTGAEGCTPGYWKNHTDRWVGLAPGDKFATVFGVNANATITLLTALDTGGGGFKALGRHATAALLNALHPDVDYGMTSSAIIDLVQDAYASGNAESAKNTLEKLNEQGCPLGGTPAT
jgi:hypothetical protein